MSKPIEELAIELLELQGTRPAKHIPLLPNEERLTKINFAYRDHMHQEFLREQEIYARIGIENGNAMIDQIRKTIKLLSH